MDVHPIRTDADHEAAPRGIEALWGAAEGGAEGERLDVLVTLAEDYERRRWPIEPLDPVRAIELAMAMNGHTRAELAALIGQSRATERADAADAPQDRARLAGAGEGAGAGLCAGKGVRNRAH